MAAEPAIAPDEAIATGEEEIPEPVAPQRREADAVAVAAFEETASAVPPPSVQRRIRGGRPRFPRGTVPPAAQEPAPAPTGAEAGTDVMPALAATAALAAVGLELPESVFTGQPLPPIEPVAQESTPESLESGGAVEISVSVQESAPPSLEPRQEAAPPQEDKAVADMTAVVEAATAEAPQPVGETAAEHGEAIVAEAPQPVEETAAEHGEAAETVPSPEPLAITPSAPEQEPSEQAVAPTVEPPLESEWKEPEAVSAGETVEVDVLSVPVEMQMEIEMEIEVEADSPNKAAAKPVTAVEPPAEVEAESHGDPAQLSLLSPEPTPDRSTAANSE